VRATAMEERRQPQPSSEVIMLWPMAQTYLFPEPAARLTMHLLQSTGGRPTNGGPAVSDRYQKSSFRYWS